MNHGFHRTPLVPSRVKALQYVLPCAVRAAQCRLSNEVNGLRLVGGRFRGEPFVGLARLLLLLAVMNSRCATRALNLSGSQTIFSPPLSRLPPSPVP